MENKSIKDITEIAQYVNELAKDSGIPGIGLVGHFSQKFYNMYLEARFERFTKNAEVDENMLNKILDNEDFSNYFYSALETVRRTHSKLGQMVLALLYKDYWNDASVLIPAMRDFAEISDETIHAFIDFYENSLDENDEVNVYHNDGGVFFKKMYPKLVELIKRDFFLQVIAGRVGSGNPIEGCKWERTNLYYKYCKIAYGRTKNEKKSGLI